MSAMIPGTRVRQIVNVIEGDVSDIRWSPDTKAFEVLVHYTADGESHNRWFLESQVQVVAAPAAATPAPAAAPTK
jgi:hypothetical protein